MAANGHPEPIRVFVADDNGTFRDALCAVVAATAGFEIIGAACSGLEALEVFVTLSEPDLVLLDVQMPGLDGIETARRIRRLNPDVVIVLLTARGPVVRGDAAFPIEDKHLVCPAWLADLWRRHGR